MVFEKYPVCQKPVFRDNAFCPLINVGNFFTALWTDFLWIMRFLWTKRAIACYFRSEDV